MSKITLEACILTFKRPAEIMEATLSFVEAYDFYFSKVGQYPPVTLSIREQSQGKSITTPLLDLIASKPWITLNYEDDLGFQKTTLDFYWNFEADYGWFISDDDIIDKDALIIIFEEIAFSQPSIAMFNYQIFKGERHKIKTKNALGKTRRDCCKQSWLANFHIHPAMPSNVILKKNVLRKDIVLNEALLLTEFAGLYIQYASFKKNFKGIYNPKILVGYRAGNAVENYHWDNVFGKAVPELLRALQGENYNKTSIYSAILRVFCRYIVPEVFYSTARLRFRPSRLLFFLKNYTSTAKTKVTLQ